MAEPAVQVDAVSKRFRVYHQRNQTLKQTVLSGRRTRYEEFWALRDVSLEIPTGATFGIIGENGSGKSTLLKCITGILRPDGGAVTIQGRLAALLELGAGFHPEYTGRENIYLNAALLGLSRKVVDERLDAIVAFADLARFIDNPVKTYSSGMYARLGFAIAVHVDPDILLVDEVLAVGDEGFQRKCYERIDQLKAEGKTMILVSHALETIRDHCRDCAWLDHGELRAIGPADDVIAQYLSEVRAREVQRMEAATEELHRQVPSGRLGVGVTRVTFEGPAGAGREFDSGDRFDTLIEYHSPGERLEGARFTVEFIRDDGLLVYSTSSDADGTPALPGKGTVRLRVPALSLLPGLYRLGVTIADAESDEPYTVMANAFPFRVRAGALPERGVARIEHHWELPLNP